MRTARLALIVAATLLPAGLASACPNCKDSIPNSDAPSSASVPGAFNRSIFFMLGGVTLVGCLVVRMIVKETRA